MEGSASCCKNERPRLKKKETWEEICHAEQELNTLEAKIRGAESLQEIAAALKETSFVKEGN